MTPEWWCELLLGKMPANSPDDIFEHWVNLASTEAVLLLPHPDCRLLKVRLPIHATSPMKR